MVENFSSTDAEVHTLTSQRRRPFIGHGALREDDSQRTLRSPLLTSPSGATNTSPTASIASQTHVNSSARSPPPTFLGFRHRHYANIRELRGKISRVPRFWLWPRFLNNSFFAKRLVFAGFLVSVALAWGVTVYNIKIIQWLIDFKTTNPDDFDKCRMPFKRELLESNPATTTKENTNTDVNLEEGERGSTSVPKIKRRFVFQLCELLAVCALVYDAALVIFFLRVLFTGAIYACGSYEMHLFTLGGAVCYVGLFIVIYYFARYREHIKMQLGAFTESDQTGDIRKHNLDLGRDRKSEMREILDYAQARGLTSSEFGFPRKVYASPKLKFKFFARTRRNPVHVAAYHGNIRALELLEEYGFDMAALDKYNSVHFSTGSLFWYFARIFVKRPSNSLENTAVSIFQATLMTPLHCAVSTGQVDTVRWLLSHGAPPNTLAQASFRSNRVPPIFLAEHAEIARELLSHACLRTGNYAVAQELEEWGSDVALTPFHLAAARNNVLAVRKFISRKTDVDCLGEMGYVGLNRRTPLHWAAISGSTEAVDALLKAGADPNFQDARGRSPLHWAARLNKLEVVRSLIRAGAEPNLADGEFMTPLMCAASALDVSRELFSELTTAGGDIAYQLPTTGDTALHIAVREENRSSALAALANGGDLMRMNSEGLRPLDCTASTRLLFELKRAAGQRDVMISYTHSHLAFARKLRQSLEEANVTTWLDLMDPSGIGGGAVWREEIARGITNASVVLCILTEDYASSEWCLKELALAKQVGTPILAVSTEGAIVDENLQVYLYTRQIIPFEPAIVGLRHDEGRIEYDYDESRYRSQFHLLLDGVRDEVEKRRFFTKQKNVASSRNLDVDGNDGEGDAGSSSRGTMLQTLGNARLSPVAGSWNAASSSSPSDLQEGQFVFLSHGDKHIPFVETLAAQLVEAGVACYSDRNVSGQDFNTRIQIAQETILRCSCFVVLVSRQTMGNELVRDQLAFAEDKSRPIFPIVLNDLNPGLDKRYSLGNVVGINTMGAMGP
ncbi:Ankyrin repeat-containing domain [Phytophthora cactorum]|nr:Ankyrin repeat-containing domain [Phytophthora cactorum]